jgi:hypothetical protein
MGRQISAICSASLRAVCYSEESSLVSAFVYTNSEASHIWTHRKRCRIDSDALGPHTAYTKVSPTHGHAKRTRTNTSATTGTRNGHAL